MIRGSRVSIGCPMCKPRASGDDPDHKVTVLPTSHRPHERSGDVGAVDVAEFLRWILSI